MSIAIDAQCLLCHFRRNVETARAMGDEATATEFAKALMELYLDESLKRFETVYPACGSSNSAIELTIAELEEHSAALQWVDVCKNWE